MPTLAAIVGIPGPTLDAATAEMFRALPPAGVILFGRNVEDPAQLVALTSALRAVLPEHAVLLVDQEGGRVARLRLPHWRAQPSAGRIAGLYAADAKAGVRAAWLTGALIGVECAAMGFDVVCAPVLDLLVAGMSDVVGDRSFGADPAKVAALGRAVAEGLLAAGVQPVMKHLPGHGRAKVDSHLALPVISATDLADLLPFQANADLPWAMTAHILYQAWDADRPATLSPRIIAEVIRGSIGFQGVLVSDDLAMQALTGAPDSRALAALEAGCDLAMYCAGDPAGTRAVLRACPALSTAAIQRLRSARELAQAHQIALDAAEMAAERDGLF
jgi:beta-N-acetylhexosaminidase